MQRLEVSGAVRPIYGSLGVKRLNLSDRRLSKQSWHSVGQSDGPALIVRAGETHTLYIWKREKHVFATGHVSNSCYLIVKISLGFTAFLIQFSSALFLFAS